jgi:hypothetical protein
VSYEGLSTKAQYYRIKIKASTAMLRHEEDQEVDEPEASGNWPAQAAHFAGVTPAAQGGASASQLC